MPPRDLTSTPAIAPILDPVFDPALDPILDISRRRLLTGLPALGMLAAGLSCGDDDEGDSGEDATVTIDDYFGPVTIPAKPQRVIAADGSTLPVMLSLGMKPIAAGFNRNSLPAHLASQMDGVEDITTEGGIDLERALALNPDLLVTYVGNPGNPWNKETYERYKAALPTFGYAFGYVYIEEITSNVTEIARALGLSDRAEQLIADYERRVAGLRERVEAAGLADRPVSVIRIMNGASYWICVGTSESIAFRALGIARPENQQDPESFGIEVSMEQLNLLNEADTVFIYIDDNATADGDELLASTIWQGLEPVRNNRVHRVSSGIWNTGDIASLMLILDDIEELFIAPAEAG